MNGGYELVKQELIASQDLSILVLGRIGTKETFIDELAHDYRKREEAAAITRAAVRLAERGTKWALECQILKRLKVSNKGLAVYELKVRRKRYRVMTYLHDDARQTPVLLFSFMGHAGLSGGGIRKETLQKGMNLAYEARALMNKEEGIS